MFWSVLLACVTAVFITKTVCYTATLIAGMVYGAAYARELAAKKEEVKQ